jgi:cell wall-associated NlpC family hydrolase
MPVPSVPPVPPAPSVPSVPSVPSGPRRARRSLVALLVAPLLLLADPAHADPAHAAPAHAAAPAAAAPSAPSGTVAVTTAETSAKTTRVERIKRALRIAKRQQGDPYKYGAAGPDRFDCSGLVYFATHRAGFTGVPRTSSAQSKHMSRIKRTAMRRGDFVFFTGSSGVYHVGVFVGRKDGKVRIVHAPGSGKRVRTDPVWTNSWFPASLR